MADALAAYAAEQAKPLEQERKGLRPIAQQYGVSFKTLSRHYRNEQSNMSSFNATKQKLTTAEEQVIVDFAAQSADRGIPLTHTKPKIPRASASANATASSSAVTLEMSTGALQGQVGESESEESGEESI